MKSLLLSVVVLLALLGCATPSRKSEQSSPSVCPVHHTPLVRVAGYAPSGRTMADPSWDYVRFMSEAESQYPFVRPWYLSEEPESGWRSNEVALVCTQCQSSFDSAFAAYRQLNEDDKQARFLAVLKKDVEKRKVEPDGAGNSHRAGQ